jgi:hypothetical protein
MSAAVQALRAEATLVPSLVGLEMRAETRAYLWWKYQIEIHEAVDPLQEFAEQSGLVDEIGQEAVQTVIAAPFKRLRAIAAAEEARRDRLWTEHQAAIEREMDAAGDSNSHTAKSTMDAFWYVLQQNDAEVLRKWLDDHPHDREYLHKVWKQKCSQKQK